MMHRLGCVSFLNSKPLIEPLVGRADVEIHFAVPAELLALVDAGTVSTALLSVVDYHAAQHELLLVPAGMIGCDGPTLTVRVFSRVPPGEIRTLHADTDSHTSVILARLILRERYGATPVMVPLARSQKQEARSKKQECESENSEVQAMVLIGDKVVTAAPDPLMYEHQLDLGEQWRRLTGLPFVFAMWMMRKDMVDRELAGLLAEARRRGADLTEQLLTRYSAERGWPRELARRYFTEYLRYEVTPRARQGLARFYEMAARCGLLTLRREVEYLEIDRATGGD